MARDENFFKRMTRLFSSGPSIQRFIKQSNYEINQDVTGTVQQTFRMYGRAFGAESKTTPIGPRSDISINRQGRYAVFETMDIVTPEISKALDVYADEIAGADDRGKNFHIFCEKPPVKKALSELFYEVMDIENNIRNWVRSLLKYGDFFLYHEVIPHEGIVAFLPLPCNSIERLDGYDKNDPLSVQFKSLVLKNIIYENWQVTHFRLLSNSLFYPYGTSILDPIRRTWDQLCLFTDSTVWVDGCGYKKISEVEIGDTICSFDFENKTIIKNKVISKQNNGIKKTVKVQLAHRELIVTPDHRILVKDKNGKFVYKEAQELICSHGLGGIKSKNADRLVLPVIVDGNEHLTYTKEQKDIILGKDFFRFFGFMIGDGWINHNRSSIGFALGIDEEQNNYYINIARKLLGKDGKITTRPGTRSSQINFSSINFVTMFEELGFKTGFANKEIPDWVWGLNQECRLEFIRGLFDADGSYSHGTIQLSNKKLIEQLQILCQQTGLQVSSIKTRKGKKDFDKSFNKVVDRKDAYRLYINFNKIHNDVVYEIVNRVVDNEDSEVYDLGVEHELHNFVAQGVVVHNCMAEDSMLTYRVVRSPERKQIFVEVGAAEAKDIPSFMDQVKSKWRSLSNMDQATGRHDFRFNPVSAEQDIFIPQRNGVPLVKIEQLPSAANATNVEDITYLQNKMFAGLGVPKAYLNYDDNLSSKATLAQSDIRFSRTIAALQKVIITELEKIAIIHLYSKGFVGDDLTSFKFKFANPSSVAQQQRLGEWSTKLDIVQKITSDENPIVDSYWLQKNILELSDDEIAAINRGKIRDFIRANELQSLQVDDGTRDAQVTDYFDGSGYVPPNSNQPGQPTQSEQPEQEQILIKLNQNPAQPRTPGDGLTMKGSSGDNLPVKANPYLSRQRHNERRRVGPGQGARATSTPDFNAMLSPDNKYMKDVFGMKNDFKQFASVFEHEEKIVHEDLASENFKMTSTVTKILKNFDNSQNIKRSIDGRILLTEEKDDEEIDFNISE